MTQEPIDQLRRLAETTLRTAVEITTAKVEHATGTLARMRAGDIGLIGKIHRTSTLHKREAYAYHNWTPYLGDAAPRLIAIAPELPGIVVTAVPGKPLHTVPLSSENERDAHRDAGRILRTLHQLPSHAASHEITTYLAERGEHWLNQLTNHLAPHDTDLVHSHLQALTTLTTARVSPCHLDFQPRNLLWHVDNRTRVIDFENSREDLAARDLTRLATRIWPQRPDLESAFLEGYGPLDETDTAVLRHVTALEAVTTLAYGLRNNEPDLADVGRSLLTDLRR
ncbi:hypothetical protein CDG81_13490 [Actinopolyspora erythraea]|uniref:Aminoglycoside phosphotransferase domain-containing protein n=1 Tax=Actinopolyspora erythraea TaxID=414996 RepID=A0A223RTD8_9ACTN|nr:aminoglycoside phosphotransferase family protein [Actinopolyspora erythraea]ASU79133.1 hypothetical protein CDG81_13490 [Actinopolyspora erythraea]